MRCAHASHDQLCDCFAMATGNDVSFKCVQKQRQWQEVRRTEALERQRAQRLVSIQHARRLGGHQQIVEDVRLEVR